MLIACCLVRAIRWRGRSFFSFFCCFRSLLCAVPESVCSIAPNAASGLETIWNVEGVTGFGSTCFSEGSGNGIDPARPVYYTSGTFDFVARFRNVPVQVANVVREYGLAADPTEVVTDPGVSTRSSYANGDGRVMLAVQVHNGTVMQGVAEGHCIPRDRTPSECGDDPRGPGSMCCNDGDHFDWPTTALAFFQANPCTAVTGWAGGGGGGYVLTSVSDEIRSGAAAAKVVGGNQVVSGGTVVQMILFNASEGRWPSEVRVRGCSRPLSVIGCGGSSDGCAGYTMTATARPVADGATTVAVAQFDPTAAGYHCREVRVVNEAGIQEIELQATLRGLAGAAVFDDFDATVVRPSCWGKHSYCRGIRDSWAGKTVSPTPSPTLTPSSGPTRIPTPTPTLMPTRIPTPSPTCVSATDTCQPQGGLSDCCGYNDFVTGNGQHCDCSVFGTDCTCVPKFQSGANCLFDEACLSNACGFGLFVGKRCE